MRNTSNLSQNEHPLPRAVGAGANLLHTPLEFMDGHWRRPLGIDHEGSAGDVGSEAPAGGGSGAEGSAEVHSPPRMRPQLVAIAESRGRG